MDPIVISSEKAIREINDNPTASIQSSGDAVINIDSRTTTAVDTSQNDTEGTPPPRLAVNQEISHTTTMPLQDYPRGYPLQAAFQSSESSFSIYRAFNYLHSRVILQLQDELRCLEEDLADLDQSDHEIEGTRARVTSRASDLKQAKRSNQSSEREGLLSKIREKLLQYDEILASARKLNAFQRPSNRDYRSLRSWFFNEKPLSYEPEEKFIKLREDLITLRLGREWAGFDGLIETGILKLRCQWLQNIFATKELREKTNSKYLSYYSPCRIEKLVGLIITFIIFILLVLPVVAMYKLTSIADRNSIFDAIGILVVFTLLFSAAMSLLTKAKRHELFAASAAYCAVLVVFISNFSTTNIPITQVTGTG
ncbi:hypothetical protein CC78DRAFT_571032 [Lojkania enalia]|uniref:DUF6594 domain-containing protein n=1 Tax=Lojkania enalia TaxID=147567 RepID=A0A9P4K3Q3_9PLEO|nr:hypothetical protein CC78DRAFT_571032 [Didymosphaeria enalia]